MTSIVQRSEPQSNHAGTLALPLAGKVALVSGGGVGIGAATVDALAAAGADVALTYLTHEPNEILATVERHGRQSLSGRLDITQSLAVETFVGDVSSHFGRLDIVVANAGGLLGRIDLGGMSDEHWESVIAANLSGTFYLIRACLRHMSGPGRIIVISSMAAITGGSAGAGAYAAAKAGLVGLARALAKEIAPRGITVNVIAPGLILDTPFHESFTPKADQLKAVDRLPVGRAGQPADVAAAIVFLASDQASFITGELMRVDGGQSLT
jgi:3-oxoacyl-[acyl-carrier protein] reductase